MISKFAQCALGVLTVMFVFGCNGSNSVAPKDTSLLGVETTSTGKRVVAKLVGSGVVVSDAADDQQNPFVIYLPDRNIYFSVWEDYRNRNTTGSDIYGRFINLDGTTCGSDFRITQASGNETVPTAAYRQVNNAPASGKIVVAWQDDRGNASGGYVYYSTITSIPTGGSCAAVSQVVSGDLPIGYNGTDAYGISATTHPDVVLTPSPADGTNKTFGKLLIPYVDPSTIVIKGTVGGQSQLLFGDGKGGFTGAGTGTLNPVNGSLSVTFTTAPDAGKNVTVTYTSIPFATATATNDKLLSRKQPKISYDSNRDIFWIVWTESRDQVNSYSDLCFDVFPVNKEFGDGIYPGYIRLKGDDLAEMVTLTPKAKPSDPDVIGADIIRNETTTKNRLISKGDPSLTPQAFEYEFFTSVNNVAIATASNSSEALMAWEGIKQKISFSCSTDSKGIITVTFTDPAPADDGKVHIYGMFDNEIAPKAIHAKRVDADNKAAASNYPAIAYDPIAQRFLVAWEDLRDGPDTKIYGQFLYSGGDLYGSNRIISFSDTNGDGKQDDNVAKSSQTRPFITYDSVRQNYFVSWQDGRNGSVSLENMDIYGQMLNSEGSASGANYAISTAPGSQLNPIVAYNSSATDANGKQFFAVWKNGVTQSDILGQRFSLGNPVMTLLKTTDKSALTPALIDFGAATVNQLVRYPFIVRNSGDTTLSIDCVDPAPNAPFSFENLPTELGTCNDGKVLQLTPSSETTLTAKFLPTSGGTFTGSFTLNSDGGNSTVNVQGLGNPPVWQIFEGDGTNDGTLNYGTLQAGETKDLTLTINNNSIVTYSITSITGASGTFTLINPPTLPVTLATNASTTITVRFTPTAEGAASGQLTINTDKSLSSTINLAGTATASVEGNQNSIPTSGTSGTSAAPSSGGKSGCFIATAAYGSYLDPNVVVLRKFRDHVLLKSTMGTAFVRCYYRYSPPIADFIRDHDVLRVVTRWLLTPLVFAVKYAQTAGILSLALLSFGWFSLKRRSQQ